jgi:hypothetical protein
MAQNQAHVFVADSAAYRFRYRCRTPAGNDNSGSGTYCPRCNKTSNAPVASEYRGKGLVSHHWNCGTCGHDWITVLHVPY